MWEREIEFIPTSSPALFLFFCDCGVVMGFRDFVLDGDGEWGGGSLIGKGRYLSFVGGTQSGELKVSVIICSKKIVKSKISQSYFPKEESNLTKFHAL